MKRFNSTLCKVWIRWNEMAQLIKLQDYVSRYETDPFRYPAQFIRLKKENWKKMRHLWSTYSPEDRLERYEEYQNLEAFVFRNGVPRTEMELKQYFLDGMYPFQLKWASRTIREMSFLDDIYKGDETLKYFLQRFPDTFLLMYAPIFRLKKAPVEGDHIMIHPQGIYCVKVLERDSGAKIIAGDDRTWHQEHELVRSEFLSPLLSLKRTYRIVRNILQVYEIDLPIKQLVLAPNHTIEAQSEPYATEYVGANEYHQWFDRMRGYISPIKSVQLKAMRALLNHSQRTSIKRPEWDDEDDMF